MKTKRGIYLDLSESDYIYELDGIAYYFSSEFNKNRYKINCNFDLYFQLSFYKKIEKRGFRVVELSSNRNIHKDITLINTII